MCEFFSAWATRDGRVLFCEDDSHAETALRAGLRDRNGYAVKIEVHPVGDGWGPVLVDEPTTPGWWTEDQAAWEARVIAVAEQVSAAWAVYAEAMRAARAICDEATRPALACCTVDTPTAWAVYEEARHAARAAYAQAIRPIDGYIELR